MSKTGNALRQLNSTVRTLLMAVVVGGLGFVGYQTYVVYAAPRRALATKDRELTAAVKEVERVTKELANQRAEIEQLGEEVAARDVRIDELEENLNRVQTAMRLLKLNKRLARIEVVRQAENEAGQLESTIRFYEVGDDNQKLTEPAEFTIDGDRVYVEYLVVKFEDKYVEQADLERGTAICLFERIFGENQEPGEGFVIDEVGSRPNSYARGSQTSEFEKKIWDDFWTIANDRTQAAELGIRASHAQAPSVRVKPGATYELDLRATGEFSLERVDDE